MKKLLVRRDLPLSMGLAVGPASAAPIEGGIGLNAALLLMLLGAWAIVMGVRNLNELRHKQLVPERRDASSGRPPAARRSQKHPG